MEPNGNFTAQLAILEARLARLDELEAEVRALHVSARQSHRPRFVVRLIRATLVAGLLVLTLGSSASASIPDPSGVIHGCYDSNPEALQTQLYLIDTARQQSCPFSNEAEVTWSQIGPAGAGGTANAILDSGTSGTLPTTLDTRTLTLSAPSPHAVLVLAQMSGQLFASGAVTGKVSIDGQDGPSAGMDIYYMPADVSHFSLPVSGGVILQPGSHTFALWASGPVGFTSGDSPLPPQLSQWSFSVIDLGPTTGSNSGTIYQLSQGWNLIGPQLPTGTTVQASAAAASILAASGGNLVAIYALSNGAWSPSYIDQHGTTATTPDFTLHGGQGYLVYTDKATSFTIGSAAPREGRVIHAGLTPAQRAQVPQLPPLP
jgi:hypothetical protein